MPNTLKDADKMPQTPQFNQNNGAPILPPGWNGQLPWNSAPPPMAPPQGAGMGQGQPPSGTAGLPPIPQAGGQTPPAPPLGMPPGAQNGNPAQAAAPPPMGALAMAAGGMVGGQPMTRFMDRSHAGFPQLRQHLGLSPRFAAGGAVQPVILRAAPDGYAEGGLVQAAKAVRGAGRWEDSMVVHLNPDEIKELSAAHGPPTINPETGLPEFGLFSFLKKALKVIAPIAVMAIPGIGPAIGATLGLSGTLAAGVGSAILGAGVGAITGGGKGALIGGLTGGLGGAFGPSISGGLEGLGIGPQTARALVNAGLGAGASAAGGGNPLTGALTAGALSYFAPQFTDKISNIGRPAGAVDPLADMVRSATPDAFQSGSDAGFAANALPDGTFIGDAPSATAAPSAPLAPGQSAAQSGSGGGTGGGSMLGQALPALALLSLAGQSGGPKVITTPPPADNAPDYFHQQFTPTPYAPQIDQDVLAALINDPGGYAAHGGAGFYKPSTSGFKFAKGGALQMAAQHLPPPSPSARAGIIHGRGDGQSDEIDAKLAQNEHVIDAMTVAAAGRGSSDAGHKRIEKWKADVRREAGIANPKKAPMMKTGALAQAFAAGRKGKRHGR